jgi:hypothetical protein
MNNKLFDLLQTKLPEIAEYLKTTTEIAYEKILWFVRISGYIELSQFIGWAIFYVIYWVFAVKSIKRIDEEHDSTIWLIVFLASVLFSVIYLELSSIITTIIIKIVSPEFYLINQLVQKLTQ